MAAPPNYMAIVSEGDSGTPAMWAMLACRLHRSWWNIWNEQSSAHSRLQRDEVKCKGEDASSKNVKHFLNIKSPPSFLLFSEARTSWSSWRRCFPSKSLDFRLPTCLFLVLGSCNKNSLSQRERWRGCFPAHANWITDHFQGLRDYRVLWKILQATRDWNRRLQVALDVWTSMSAEVYWQNWDPPWKIWVCAQKLQDCSARAATGRKLICGGCVKDLVVG